MSPHVRASRASHYATGGGGDLRIASQAHSISGSKMSLPPDCLHEYAALTQPGEATCDFMYQSWSPAVSAESASPSSTNFPSNAAFNWNPSTYKTDLLGQRAKRCLQRRCALRPEAPRDPTYEAQYASHQHVVRCA